jgi:hypothetical protein
MPETNSENKQPETIPTCDLTFCEKNAKFCQNIAQNGAFLNKNFAQRNCRPNFRSLTTSSSQNLKLTYLSVLGAIFLLRPNCLGDFLQKKWAKRRKYETKRSHWVTLGLIQQFVNGTRVARFFVVHDT